MSHDRKNSVGDKEVGKRWIYSERNTVQRVCAMAQGECSLEMYVVSFYGLGNFIG